MADSSFSADVVDAVAYGIAKVVATATVDGAAEFRKLDGLGRASAVHTMALNMVPQLQAEAIAAIGAYLRATTLEAANG